MTLNDIAIHDGCVAGVECGGNLNLSFDRCQVVLVDRLNRETGFLQVRNPVATAASGGRFVDSDDLGVGPRACCWRRRRRLTVLTAARRKQGKQRQQRHGCKPAHTPPLFNSSWGESATHCTTAAYNCHVSTTWWLTASTSAPPATRRRTASMKGYSTWSASIKGTWWRISA